MSATELLRLLVQIRVRLTLADPPDMEVLQRKFDEGVAQLVLLARIDEKTVRATVNERYKDAVRGLVMSGELVFEEAIVFIPDPQI